MGFESTISVVRKLLRICAKYGGARWYLSIVIGGVAAIAQITAIGAVIPFLSSITEPDRFLESGIGSVLAFGDGPLSGAQVAAITGASFLVAVAVANCLVLYSAYLDSRLVWRVGHNLRREVYQSFLGQKLDFYLKKEAGASLKNIVTDTTTLAANVLRPFISIANHLIFVAAAIIGMAFVSFKGTAVALFVILGYFWLAAQFFRAPIQRYSQSMNDAYERLYSIAEESINNITYLKFHGAEPDYVRTFDRFSEHLAVTEPRVTTTTLIPKTLFETFAVLGIVIWAVVAARNGGPTAQQVPLYGLMLFACYRLLPACQRIYAAGTRMGAYIYSLSEVESYLGSIKGQAELSPHSEVRFDIEKSVVIQDLSFRHRSGDGVDLQGISFQIDRFDRVLVMGDTGCGKTTLVSLLLQLRNADEGSISVDGKTLNPENGSAWRRSIGYVPQQVELRHGTIAENVAFSDDHIDMEKVERCCELADLSSFINDELKDGYETSVGEGDSRLSGGQRQRIGVARALYRDPTFLILDEATSALDTTTEERILKKLCGQQLGMTMLVISHRAAARQFCNKYFQMQNGKLSRAD